MAFVHMAARIRTVSVAELPDCEIEQGSAVRDAFLARGATTFRAACRWVNELPYGANTTFGDALVLFDDERGTCFTKHGVIARLADELGLPIHKNVGFYRLNDDIVTGVKAILEPHGLTFVPQMHCFLEYGGVYVDLTEGNAHGKNRTIDTYDFIVRVAPEPTREEMQQLFAEHLQRYRAVDPRLAPMSDATIAEILRQCGQLQLSRCPLMAGA